MFGFPAVALAMIRLAKPENRKAVAGVLGSAALTAIITGITEPIEYSFIFLSPILLVVNAFLFGLFNALSVAFGIRMGIGFFKWIDRLYYDIPACKKTTAYDSGRHCGICNLLFCILLFV